MAKTKAEIIAKLETLQSESAGNWREKAEWERQNRRWIRLSQSIAVQMLAKMREMNINQIELAKKMGCSQQYISKILKGKENLSLETITKIEDSLNISIFPYEYSGFFQTIQHNVAEEDIDYSPKKD